MDYDTWLTTDFKEEDNAKELAMIDKYGEDWREILESRMEASYDF